MMDGKAAVAGDIPGISLASAGRLLFFHCPDTWNQFPPDHVMNLRVLAIDAQGTQATTTWLVPRDAAEGRD